MVAAPVEPCRSECPKDQDHEDRESTEPEDEEDGGRQPAVLEKQCSVAEKHHSDHEDRGRTDRAGDASGEPGVEPDPDRERGGEHSRDCEKDALVAQPLESRKSAVVVGVHPAG